MTEAARHERRLELISTILLALATVATAWAAYQSREWTGEQSEATAKATAARIAENRFSALANRQVQIDVATFIQWLNAREEHHPGLAEIYRARFRPEFQPVFAAWIATKPFTNKGAPPTPFATARYRLKAEAQAQRLETSAAAASEQAKKANEHADNYMLGVVLFAIALFFAGLSTQMHTLQARTVILGLGCVVFLGTLMWVVTLPMKV